MQSKIIMAPYKIVTPLKFVTLNNLKRDPAIQNVIKFDMYQA